MNRNDHQSSKFTEFREYVAFSGGDIASMGWLTWMGDDGPWLAFGVLQTHAENRARASGKRKLLDRTRN